jgi:hypothetical protein
MQKINVYNAGMQAKRFQIFWESQTRKPKIYGMKLKIKNWQKEEFGKLQFSRIFIGEQAFKVLQVIISQ